MNRFPYFVLLTALLFTACGNVQAASPTNTVVVPSDTPESTFTPLPTDTPTPPPTITPDAAATAAAQTTQQAGTVLAELDKLLGDSDIPYQAGHLIWQQTDSVTISMTGPQGQHNPFKPIDEKVTAKDFIFKSDATWNATGFIFCGAILRSEPDLAKADQYQFYYLRFSGLPAWFIEYYKKGFFSNSITKDKYSDAIDMGNDATNQFVVVGQAEKFTVYLNGQRQGRFFDNSRQRMEGSFGFMAWQESGTGSCEFKNAWIWSLDK